MCRHAHRRSVQEQALKDLIVVATPEGTEVQRLRAPRELTQAQRKLRALHRKAARQTGRWDAQHRRAQQPSAGWQRTMGEVARVHARVANLRTDRLHKITTSLAQTHQVVGVETLAVKNMMAAGGARKRGLNRAIAEAALGRLLRLIDYKATWYGTHVVKADRFYPSSKTCSGCGSVKAKLALSERDYVCTNCALVIDRDLNAAVNLARVALTNVTTDPSAGFDTGGADRKTTTRPSGQPALVAMKPEPEPGQEPPAPVGAPPRKGAAA